MNFISSSHSHSLSLRRNYILALSHTIVVILAYGLIAIFENYTCRYHLIPLKIYFSKISFMGTSCIFLYNKPKYITVTNGCSNIDFSVSCTLYYILYRFGVGVHLPNKYLLLLFIGKKINNNNNSNKKTTNE